MSSEIKPYQRLPVASQFLTMKIKEKNMRDRWLLNIRRTDYPVYLLSSFLLLSSRKKIQYAKETHMNGDIIQELNNLITNLE